MPCSDGMQTRLSMRLLFKEIMIWNQCGVIDWMREEEQGEITQNIYFDWPIFLNATIEYFDLNQRNMEDNVIFTKSINFWVLERIYTSLSKPKIFLGFTNFLLVEKSMHLIYILNWKEKMNKQKWKDRTSLMFNISKFDIITLQPTLHHNLKGHWTTSTSPPPPIFSGKKNNYTNICICKLSETFTYL